MHPSLLRQVFEFALVEIGQRGKAGPERAARFSAVLIYVGLPSLEQEVGSIDTGAGACHATVAAFKARGQIKAHFIGYPS